MRQQIWKLMLFAPLLCGSAFAQTADPLADARADLQGGRPAAAFERLAPLEDTRAGDPDYDYLLGVAALESGRASRASLILERVLIVRPDHAGARLDLGRSYFAVGAYVRAQQEFDAVRAMNPPPAALKTIEAHEAMMRPKAPAEPRFAAWVEGGLGRDSNVNQATSASTVFLPVFQGSFDLSENNRARADSYRNAMAGARYGHPLGGTTTLLVGGEAKVRRHAEADTYDSSNLDGSVGLRWAAAERAGQVLLSRGSTRLSGEAYRTSTALAVDWRQVAGTLGVVDAFAQYHQLRYEQADLTGNDVNLAIVGAGWMRPYAGGGGEWYVAVFGGLERAVEGRADGDKRIAGVRAGLQQRIAAFDLGAALSAQAGRYTDENPIFLDTRNDRQLDLTLAAGWRMTSAWSLRANATLTRNTSNLSVYEYDRSDVSASLRYDFR